MEQLNGNFWTKIYVLQYKQYFASCWTSMSVFPFFNHLLLFNFDCHSKISTVSFIQRNPRPLSLVSSISEASWALPGLLFSSGFLPQIIYKDIKVSLEFTVLSVIVANCSQADTVPIIWANLPYNLFCFPIPASGRVGQIKSRLFLS